MIERAFEQIESREYATAVNLASDYKQFLRAMRVNTQCQFLLRLTSISPENRNAVLTRLNELCQRPIDEEFENPWDAALATYLWVLSNIDLHLTAVAVNRVLSCRNCWWSKKLAEQLQDSIGRSEPLTFNAGANTGYFQKGMMVSYDSHASRSAQRIILNRARVAEHPEAGQHAIFVVGRSTPSAPIRLLNLRA
jgi:hypothetical protein